MTSRLVTPSEEELKQSTILQEMIREEMRTNAGCISFERYMQMCLYTPVYGYYTSRQEIFSQSGDFITSSEHGNHYARAFASHINRLDLFGDKTTIVEIGAGNGSFAYDLIEALLTSGKMPLQYYIVEISATLRERQRGILSVYLEREDIQIYWLDKLDHSLDAGVVIANEVIDALPVHLISIRDGQVYERGVTCDQEQNFKFCERPLSAELASIIEKRLPRALMAKGEYQTEINSKLDAFVEETMATIKKGLIFFVDYGYPRQEYYLPERSMGTLICHYQHAANDNPLRWPGLQDISCNVDFTALAEAGVRANLDINCYSTQAQFLLASDYVQSLSIDASSVDAAIESGHLKNLVMPGAMGERFQVMVFTKNIELNNTQFTLRDLTYRL
jgi:SAM-dependent MidA family methyltransferase